MPFECDLCIFRKLRSEDPNQDDPRDQDLLLCIRRMNLDAFWSRASSTVETNRGRVRNQLQISSALGCMGPYEHEGPMPDHDHCGYEIAISMLSYSRRPGNTDKRYTQWGTIRKLRTSFSNQVRASPQSSGLTWAMGDSKGNYQRLASDVCASLFFSRFAEGCRHRMGEDWRPNLAMSLSLYLRLLEHIENRIGSAVTLNETNRWLTFKVFAIISYVVSLRGSEGSLLDLDGLHRMWIRSDHEDMAIITLLGKIKGEQHDRCHCIPCIKITGSGIKVKEELRRLMDFKKDRGFVSGPAVSDLQGVLYPTRVLDDMLQDILEEIYDLDPAIFGAAIQSREDIRERFHIYRTFRRTSDTRAIEMMIRAINIDLVNRWEKVEKSRGNYKPGQMKQYYAQISLLKAPFMRYTGAM